VNGFFSRSEIQAIVDKMRSPNAVGGAGRTFYVDGIVGLDSNPPDNPLKPLKLIASALSLCRNDKDDYIIVMDCWQQDTFPIAVARSRVHIIGLDVGNGMYPRMSPPTDTAIFSLGSKGYVEIAGFSLGAGATHGCIEWEVGVIEGRSKLHHLWLGWTETGRDGILVPATTDAPELEVSDILFGAGLTRDGIRLEGNSTRSIFRRSLFRKVGGIGIHGMKNGSDIAAILDNVFSIADSADGEAITMAAGVGAALISGNKAGQGKVDPAHNPYVDVTPSNDWLDNYSGKTLTQPA
jgi:hypothetical protein